MNVFKVSDQLSSRHWSITVATCDSNATKATPHMQHFSSVCVCVLCQCQTGSTQSFLSRAVNIF